MAEMVSRANVNRRKFLTGAAIASATAVSARDIVSATPALEPKASQAAPSARRPSAGMAAAETGSPAELAEVQGKPGSDYMVDVIKSLNVDYVFANPASSFRGLHESLLTYGGNRAPEFIECLHEESSIGMAHGYFKAPGKPIVVLDRPNPLNGAYVQGPLTDAGQESFVNYYSVPVRHGMTIGELAKLYNAEKHINANLAVVPMKGWMRGDWFDSTGQVWVNPSPNLRGLEAAALYPGVALIEGTNLSVGRGTDAPFERLGAT